MLLDQIIGAPSFFPTVWSWIKRWFDPITVSKIFILSQYDMKETLEKYIAPENIPRKYGGTLDFEYGMMPILEPAICNMFVSQSQNSATLDATTKAVENVVGATTDIKSNMGDNYCNELSFPIGPIKWREKENGELEAVAVGSENGSLRELTVGKIKADFGFMHGISRENTQIDWSEENVLSTTGTATQPTVDGDPEYGKELMGEDSGVQTPVDSNTKESNGRTVPVISKKPNAAPEGTPPSEDQPQTGTSVTANLAQQETQAEETTAKNTPHIVDVVHGDKAAVLEPSTVGQAGKEQILDTVEPKLSNVQQAKDVVTSGVPEAGAGVDKP
jgi:hypothetical protein